MSVEIIVSYTSPPDLYLGSPYYRPASSISLSCVARGVADSASWLWSSKYSSAFTYNSRASVRSTTRLDAYDVGRHTCTVTDVDGTTLSASTYIQLYGMSRMNFPVRVASLSVVVS